MRMRLIVIISSLLIAWFPLYPKNVGVFAREGKSSETPVVLKAVAPVYPPCALAAHTFGLVRIDARVNTDGFVTSAVFVGADEKVISGVIPHEGLECLRKAAET